MTVAVAEFQRLLTRLSHAAAADVAELLGRVQHLDVATLRALLTDAYPEVVTPFIAAAGDLTATWYEEQPVGQRPKAQDFIASTAELPEVAQLSISARWALAQTNPVVALQGSATRAVFNASRHTVFANAEREKVPWARHARAGACGFCRLQATRAAGPQPGADALVAHDHCHCLIVPDRDGRYEPAPHIAAWEDDYRAAIAAGAVTPQQIAAAMETRTAS